MDELPFDALEDEPWDAGFEGGRSLVVARLGPLLRVYTRPKGFVKRFYHQVHELPIEDWQLRVEPLVMGSFCTITAAVSIRFQPTERYARDHLEHLPALSDYIKNSHAPLLKDQMEEALRAMEYDLGWLDQGCAPVEKSIARNINEQLVMRNIQCRTRCTVTPNFGSLEGEDAASSRHRNLYLELERRRREMEERARREEHEHALNEQRRKLEREERLLKLARQEDALREARARQDVERLRTELSNEEILESEQRDSEARRHEEQIRHTARLRELEMDADINEKTRRAQTMDDMEEHIKREIELLAMERQRLLLEEEVREVKVAKAKGWVINAKRRFPLGGNRGALQDGDTPENPEER